MEEKSTSSSSRYIDRWRLYAPPQPFQATRVRMYGFVFRADPDALEALVTRYLGQPGTDYEAIETFPYVLVVFTEGHRMGSIHPPYSRLGFSGERELALWVPVRNGLRLLWHTPYIFVDNPLAHVQGLEIYGFPKEMAYVEMPDPAAEPGEFVVKAFAIERFAPDSEMDYSEVLRVSRADSNPTITTKHWSSYEECAADCNHRIEHAAKTSLVSFLRGGVDVVDDLLEAAPWPPRGTLVFLKQFPDAEDGSLACYKSIVEADMTVTDFHDGWLLGGTYVLSLPGHDSHPITRDLGLHSGQHADLAYWLDFDFTLEVGREVWRAAGEPEQEECSLGDGIIAMTTGLIRRWLPI